MGQTLLRSLHNKRFTNNGDVMKTNFMPLITLLLCACSSNEVKPDISDANLHSETNTSDKIFIPDKRQEKLNGETAIASVAIAVAVGAMKKGDEQCSKECEKELKNSINKRLENKKP